MAEPILEVVELRKRYKNTVALDGVSFQVTQGEMFGLLGPNGAGKTTLLSILSGLLDASSGTARIQGINALPLDRELRKAIGIAPQEVALYGDLSARENLLFFARLYGLDGTDLGRRVDEVLLAVGLAERGSDRVDSFSGGMKRRLNLGAALVHRPRLLFLDEPTTGVDPQSRNHIFEEIRRVNRAGTTVVYTSHYMEEVQALCPRVGILDHGRLIACDLVSTILQHLHGIIRFRVPHLADGLRRRIAGLESVRIGHADDQSMELECQDVKKTLLRLLAALTEAQVELTSLETQEPNLEHVFLHLTGHGLRD
jgi:ABC-2 type transport system ATP-binding protein